MRIVASFAVIFGLGIAALTAGQPAAPRKAPDLTITLTDGKELQLSSYKGKVVAMSFIFTTCPHCQAECQLLSKLYTEYGPRGFQPLAVAFNENANFLVNNFVEQFKVNFPIGSANRAIPEKFLGYSVMDYYTVPQIAMIDRKGMIVEQSAMKGTPNLQTETYLRALIEKLLADGAGPATSTTKKAKGGAL